MQWERERERRVPSCMYCTPNNPSGRWFPSKNCSGRWAVLLVVNEVLSSFTKAISFWERLIQQLHLFHWSWLHCSLMSRAWQNGRHERTRGGTVLLAREINPEKVTNDPNIQENSYSQYNHIFHWAMSVKDLWNWCHYQVEKLVLYEHPLYISTTLHLLFIALINTARLNEIYSMSENMVIFWSFFRY